MNTITKLFAVVLLGSAVLITACDPSGLSGTDQTLKETNLNQLVSSNQMDAAATEYEIVDLGTLDGGFSTAFGINENGQVVGFSRRIEGESHTFLWDEDGGMQDLGTFGGVNSIAYDINDGGEVVGFRTTSSGERQGFIWDKVNGERYIGAEDGINISPSSINNSGEIVGFRITSTGERLAFIWDEVKGEQTLGTLGGIFSGANGINDAGQVVGSSMTSSGEQHAFIWDEVGGMRDLGTLGGTYSVAVEINNAGQVVGSSMTSSGEQHAFIWDEVGGMRDLGSLGGTSTASGINDAGQVVGGSWTNSGEIHAFLWDEVSGMQDLGRLVGGASNATSINNKGQIVGLANEMSNLSERHATLWNPIQNSDATPPEIAFETNKTSLWPPNHKMHLVMTGISATDNSDEDPSLSVSVASNEMLNGFGDGNTDEDWQIVQANDGSYEVYVRAERSGNESGRVYTVTMTAVDASGNVAEEIVDIQVARDMGKSLK